MLLKLVDYDDRIHDFEIGNLEDIRRISIEVVSGDEIADVDYKDGTSKTFDSSYFCERIMNFDDGLYDVYNDEVNLLENEEWKSSNNSYSRMRIGDEYLI